MSAGNPSESGQRWRSTQPSWAAWQKPIAAMRSAGSERELVRLRDRASTAALAAARLFPDRPDAARILDRVAQVAMTAAMDRLQAHRGKPGAEEAWYALGCAVKNLQAHEALVALVATTGDDPWLAATGRPRAELLRSSLATHRGISAVHPAGERERKLLAEADELLAAEA
jgi:hypothetical protein